MRAPFLILLIILLISIAADLYIYIQCSRRCRSRVWCRLQAITAIILMTLMAVEMLLPAKEGSDNALRTKMWVLFGYVSVYLPKYLAIICDLLASLPRLWHHRRMKWLTVSGIVLSIALFLGMWWGALINRYHLQVREVTVEIPSLPASFEGTRLVQFSDLHTGTFDTDTTFVSRLVDRINALHPDATMFTGDIVNRRSEEMLPFVEVLSRLRAPLGVYAILGNHDYGDYMIWPSDDHKQLNMQRLYDAYSRTGMRLLLNETAWLRRGNDSIAVIGVENIGDPPFTIYGSLPRSYPDLSDSNTKILLTHNPQHWVDSIAGRSDINIPLTLSGHTHAMQIEVAGISPAMWRYPTWGGLYTDSRSERSLYVNIGCGTVGIPMRLGATPEITVITLRRAPEHSQQQ